LIATLWIAWFTSIIPALAEARIIRCAIILPTSGRETIANNCNKCRIVNIIRKRPGNAVPVTRTYNIQPYSKIVLPFRGPGRSRITSVLPCKGDPGAAKNLMDPNLKKKNRSAEEKTCIKINKSPAGGLQLVNNCTICKAALIEHQYLSKTSSKRQAYKVSPDLPLVIPYLGASRVALLAEVNCP